MNTRIPTLQHRAANAADHARRYSDVERMADATVHELDAVLGRNPEPWRGSPQPAVMPVQPTEAQELRALHLLILALWAAFGIGAWVTYLYFALGAQP